MVTVRRGQEEMVDRLRDVGLRATRPRLLVFGLLREIGGHHSVDDLVDLLARRGHRLPRMSVYNVVADLSDANVIMRADAGPGASLYEAGDLWHHHFVCRSCGAIEDVPCVVGKKPCLHPPAALDAEVDEAQVIFRGLCANCAHAKGH